MLVHDLSAMPMERELSEICTTRAAHWDGADQDQGMSSSSHAKHLSGRGCQETLISVGLLPV